MDGIGKEIQFGYGWEVVKASIYESDLAEADFNWDVQTKLNFDFNVRGFNPDYAAEYWRVELFFRDVYGDTIWHYRRSGIATEAGEDFHMEWVFTDQSEAFDMIVVTLKGGDVEDWFGHFGPIFRNIDLYLS